MTDGRNSGPAERAILPARQPPPLHDKSGGELCPDLRNNGRRREVPAAVGHRMQVAAFPAPPCVMCCSKFMLVISIDRDDPARGDVHQLLTEHLADMYATSPAESVHALDHTALSGPSITFWTAREDGDLLGCGALKLLGSPPGSTLHGEIKSMRTTASARGRGVATLMLRHILNDARARNLERVYLETGTEDYFAPARRLYARNGFTECPPFAGYTVDPNSVFMELPL